jgi:hypothetical protein
MVAYNLTFKENKMADIKAEVATLMTEQGLDPKSIPLDTMTTGALESVKEHLETHDNVTSIKVQPGKRI